MSTLNLLEHLAQQHAACVPEVVYHDQYQHVFVQGVGHRLDKVLDVLLVEDGKEEQCSVKRHIARLAKVLSIMSRRWDRIETCTSVISSMAWSISPQGSSAGSCVPALRCVSARSRSDL